MRKGKTIVTFVAALIMSCSNFTDIQPTHLLTPSNAFKTMDDFELLLNGIYAGVQSGTYYALGYGTLPDIMSDNLAENVESLGTYRSTSDWLFVSNDQTISPFWSTPYSVINNCNILLTTIDNFKETKTGQKNRLKSQALAVRALLHFDLLRYFGQSYDRNSTALGITIKTIPSLDKPGRNTVKEVYDQVYADLAQARTFMGGVLDAPINTSTDRSRIDQLVVSAIFARVAYYAKDYSTAASNATTVINGGLGLASQADFPTIWNADAITNEVIWYIKYFPGDGYAGGDVYFAVNDRVSYNPSAALLSIYNDITTNVNDIRYTSYFSSTTANRPGQLIISKYIGPTGDGLVNWKAFRVGEMYLIRAEALARTNQETAAMADLNALRTARILGYLPQSLTGSALLTAIATERRKELFLEGHRWFDLRIAGQGINRGGDCKAPATNCSLAASSFRFVWPIPQDETKANPTMAGQQNLGY